MQSWSSWFRCRSTLPTRPGLHSVRLPNEQISRLEIAKSCALFRLETRLCCSFESSHFRILESRFAQQGCDLSWHPCSKFAPKWFKFVPTAFRFCFKFGTNFRASFAQIGSNAFIFAQKSASRPASSSRFNLEVRLSTCKFRVETASLSTLLFRLCLQVSRLVPSLLRACKFRAETDSLPSLLFRLCLQVSRRTDSLPSLLLHLCFQSELLLPTLLCSLLPSFAPKLLFRVSAFKFALLRWVFQI